jgi:hypothetical protein
MRRPKAAKAAAPESANGLRRVDLLGSEIGADATTPKLCLSSDAASAVRP